MKRVRLMPQAARAVPGRTKLFAENLSDHKTVFGRGIIYLLHPILSLSFVLLLFLLLPLSFSLSLSLSLYLYLSIYLSLSIAISFLFTSYLILFLCLLFLSLSVFTFSLSCFLSFISSPSFSFNGSFSLPLTRFQCDQIG